MTSSPSPTFAETLTHLAAHDYELFSVREWSNRLAAPWTNAGIDAVYLRIVDGTTRARCEVRLQHTNHCRRVERLTVAYMSEHSGAVTTSDTTYPAAPPTLGAVDAWV